MPRHTSLLAALLTAGCSAAPTYDLRAYSSLEGSHWNWYSNASQDLWGIDYSSQGVPAHAECADCDFVFEVTLTYLDHWYDDRASDGPEIVDEFDILLGFKADEGDGSHLVATDAARIHGIAGSIQGGELYQASSAQLIPRSGGRATFTYYYGDDFYGQGYGGSATLEP